MRRPARHEVTSLLKQDHEHVKQLLDELEATTSRGVKRRRELLARIAGEVRLHAYVEETIFYPAFHAAGETNDDEQVIQEARVEHRLVHELLPELEDTDPATELFSARAKVLKDLIEHHALEEERGMLPRAQQLLSEEARMTLGREIQDRKLAIKNEGLPLHIIGAKRNGNGNGKRNQH